MLGIDAYDRYQDITDWPAVKAAGVRFAYFKGTDGGGKAPVTADAFVRGAKGVGIPCGLYHFAQLTPSPEAQADVLHADVQRLAATGLPPALDFEATVADSLTAAQGADFCRRFIRRLREHGHQRVTLYANTSHLTKITPDSWDDASLLIWAANYGSNDGNRHGYSYAGHVDIHQYTDRGRLPGITPAVDLNESLTDILEDDMLTDAQAQQLGWIYQQLTGSHNPGEFPGWTTRRDGDVQQSYTLVDYLRETDRRLVNIEQRPQAVVDPAALADPAFVQALAAAVADEQARRLEE